MNLKKFKNLPILLSSVAFLLIVFQAPTRGFADERQQWFRSSLPIETFLTERVAYDSTDGNLSPFAEIMESAASNGSPNPVSIVGQKHATIKYATHVVDAVLAYNRFVRLADISDPVLVKFIQQTITTHGSVDAVLGNEVLLEYFSKAESDDFLLSDGLAGGKGSGFKSSLNPGERALASMNRIQEYSSAFDAMFFHASDGVVIGGGLPKEVKDLIQGKTLLSLSSASGCSSLFCSIYKARSEEQKDKNWWEEKKDKTSVNEFAINILTEDFIRSNDLLATGDLAQRFQAAELSSAPTSVAELERLLAQSRALTQTALPAAKKASVCIAYDSASPPNCISWSP